MEHDDLHTTPPSTPHSPATLISQREYGLEPTNPVHKSHIKAWLACPRAFYLRMIRGLGPQNQRHFATGRFYHRIMQTAIERPTATPNEVYFHALNDTPQIEKIGMHPGALRHAKLLANNYAGKLNGDAEHHFLTQIGAYWFAGSYDFVPTDPNEPLTDWKTSAIPCTHDANYGPESTLYRLAYNPAAANDLGAGKQVPESEFRPLRFVRLAKHWDLKPTRKASEHIVTTPMTSDSVRSIINAVNEIRGMASSLRRFSDDCSKCPVATLCMKPEYLLPVQGV